LILISVAVIVKIVSSVITKIKVSACLRKLQESTVEMSSLRLTLVSASLIITVMTIKIQYGCAMLRNSHS